MDKIWYINPSKSEVIGRCGGDDKNEEKKGQLYYEEEKYENKTTIFFKKKRRKNKHVLNIQLYKRMYVKVILYSYLIYHNGHNNG